ncbi:MAG: hypothetical protein MK236_07425 [Pedosphaera sp.]|nr:hypothetical protein [Pedosphaera sp.]
MKPALFALLVFCLLSGGCKTAKKFNPFTNNSYCESVFAYPPRAITWILDIEKSIGPKDFNLEDYD